MIEDTIHQLIAEHVKRFGYSPKYLRMPEESFASLVSELKADPVQFRPISKEQWLTALETIAGGYMNVQAANFNEMKFLEFKVVAMYSGLLVGTSPEYTLIAVAARVSQEMDNGTGVVYEDTPSNT